MTTPPTALVIGASFAGLFTAAALARAGCTVTLLERDALPDTAQPRPGVPQGRQPHILLHRGLRAAEALLPGLEQELVDAGGVAFSTGEMPQLIAQGWLPQGGWAPSIVSLSRTRLELVVRRRVLALPGVRLAAGVRVVALDRVDGGWEVLDADGGRHRAPWVVDASGRGSRLPVWLGRLGAVVAEPEVVEARLGYACRTYRGDLPFRTGVLLASTPDNPAGGSALPIEDGRWLICAAGYGERRPGRETAGFETYLESLTDPALAEIARALEPESDVAIHRQTGNRRHAYGRARDWPDGLLAVGDALCAFNPVYGQGITVAAMQAEVVGRAFAAAAAAATRRGEPPAARALQRRLSRLVGLPWTVSTSEDRRYVGLPPTRTSRLTAAWTGRMGRLAATGDDACCHAFGRLYHLTGTPAVLFSPRVAWALARSVGRPAPAPLPRPAVLAQVGQRSAA